ncbi:hypothetical protein [Bacillus sp. 2205SS5-2]|uniref:hypothetical protein n=1 Tax=Bacillus sp. 2205SS5-2 TaxID=3109031 RepID=UPI0030075686
MPESLATAAGHEKRKWLPCGVRQMKNPEVMSASLEGYSFDPEPQATHMINRRSYPSLKNHHI